MLAHATGKIVTPINFECVFNVVAIAIAEYLMRQLEITESRLYAWDNQT